MPAAQTARDMQSPVAEILKSLQEANNRICDLNNRFENSTHKMVDTSTPDKLASERQKLPPGLLPEISDQLQILHQNLDVYSSWVSKIEGLF